MINDEVVNFHALEVVCCGSKTQLQVGKNFSVAPGSALKVILHKILRLNEYLNC